MSEKLSPGAVRDYWTRQAREYGASPSASWSDRRVIELEIAALAKRLQERWRVLDVGCANGYSTLELARRRPIEIRGVDYIPEMVEEARRRLVSCERSLRRRVSFAAGDATELCEESGSYDAALCVRVLINLDGPERQEQALGELARVVKTGGRVLLSEASVQGWERVNALRARCALPPIAMPAFNRYLDEDQLAAWAAGCGLELSEQVAFASTYYVGTRLLKPLLARLLGLSEEFVADPQSQWNRWYARLPAWGDHGTQRLFVFEKK